MCEKLPGFRNIKEKHWLSGNSWKQNRKGNQTIKTKGEYQVSKTGMFFPAVARSIWSTVPNFSQGVHYPTAFSSWNIYCSW